MNIFTYDAIVVGSGAAGFNAACRLKHFGKNVALITEGINCGTSRNTGSDKQTYYKLGLGGDAPDSVAQMAENLFAGGSVDGDNALCEAALSARCFMNLCELGVPFPVNRYGEYIGYKTDHDPFARATSAGPLTSKFMTEALEKRAKELEIPGYDGYRAVEILKDENGVCGLLCLDQSNGDYAAFHCGNIILATGGPAGIYADSVFPECHTGSTGLGLLAGAKAQNLTEWQFGLASVAPRWNVSGTYMQVLPRFVSVDAEGKEYEFLADYFEDPYEALSNVFLKGYQWPFDSKKVLEGSSVIDLLVYRECVLKQRQVYLDYTRNPFGLEQIPFEKLSEEAYTYLKKAEACFGTPIDRLAKMNTPAIELYAGKGLDITKDYLEIALCAQHHNGGLAVDCWWQTDIRGLFAAGECAGTHGVTRPGGSALNAGQVGSLRAAQYISAHPHSGSPDFEAIAREALKRHQGYFAKRGKSAAESIQNARRRMSDLAGAIRKKDALEQALAETRQDLANIGSRNGDLVLYYQLKDLLVTQEAVLTAMLHYIETVGATRGSALNFDEKGDLRQGLEEQFRFAEETGETRARVQEAVLTPNGFQCRWRPVRPIPAEEGFFENVWRRYREDQNIY